MLKALAGGKAEQAEVARRLKLCRACKHLRTVHKTKWDHLAAVFGIRRRARIYCGQCGCGTWALAELHTKLGFKKLKCPVGKWGEADALPLKEAVREHQLKNRTGRQAKRGATAHMVPAEFVRKHMRPVHRMTRSRTELQSLKRGGIKGNGYTNLDGHD